MLDPSGVGKYPCQAGRNGGGFKVLVVEARKAYIENPDDPYYHAVTAITNYLNELRNDDESAEVKPKQSSTLPTWAVTIFGLIIVMGIYLQPNPEPARPERHQGQMEMQLDFAFGLCMFHSFGLGIFRWITAYDEFVNSRDSARTVAIQRQDTNNPVSREMALHYYLLHSPEARAELARLRRSRRGNSRGGSGGSVRGRK
ncbi:hypothetical protein FPQ18DRAFT_303749 [Pyronema domesticum]|nr:hypothetical protein FPQ18DRAFT_303749 [Pyronema domesticum]